MSQRVQQLAYGLFGVGTAIALSVLQAPAPVSTLGSAPLEASELEVSEFSEEPLYSQIESYATQIAGDPADVYLPMVVADDLFSPLPVALMLPGALVERTQYSEFAEIIAQHGFVVIVPSRERSLSEFGVSGQLAESSQITATLDYVAAADDDPTSPLAGKVDSEKMALLGHSHGGAVGLLAIADTCIEPFFCLGSFSRPPEVVAGVFYGVNTYNPQTESYIPTSNAGIPVALVQGSEDGVATVEEATETFELIDSPPKALITVEGANHFGITNQNNPEGAMPDSSVPTLEQTESVETIAQWTGYFLRAHVLGDAEALVHVYEGGDRQDDRVPVKGVRDE
jgi:dienelactone hydrolase